VSKPPEPPVPLGNGTFRVTRGDGTQVLAYGVADGQKTWVFVDGTSYVLEPSRRGRSAGAHDAAALTAPMPATVAQIHVTVGDTVKAGDLLMTLEAMKMELPIRATSDGTVNAINCRAGELVQPGAPLVTLA